MRTLLGLVAARQTHEGPWIEANGSRRATAEIHGLREGDRLLLDLESTTGTATIDLSSMCADDIDLVGTVRYRFRKLAGPSPVDTHVLVRVQ